MSRSRSRRGCLPAAALLVGLLPACGDQRPRGAAEVGPVVISEIMYHPVLDDGPIEAHEFVELHNRTDRDVSLDAWKLTEAVRFTFPAGTTLAARAFLVVAKSKARLLADVPAYNLPEGVVVGDYSGSLDNGGERLVLVDAADKPVDEAVYADSAPWPVGADALGAGESWLPEAVRPVERHRFMGRSLERIRVDEAGRTAVNWAASALDGATPGRANGISGPPLPVVTELSVGDGAPLRATNTVRIRAKVVELQDVDARAGASGDSSTAYFVESFVDDMERSDEATQRTPLIASNDGSWEAQLPAQPAGSVVRYRVVREIGGERHILTPREGDPRAFYAYFVDPEIPGKTPAYQLFISRESWTNMWRHVAPGRVPGNAAGTNPFACEVNPLWNARVPAVLVVGGQVHDVQVRYHGSFQRRLGGLAVKAMRWPAELMPPMAPSPLRVLSWSIKFPRYDRFEGKRSFSLNNLTQSCHGFNTLIGSALFERAGVPAAHSQYVRYYVNGVYYHYMLRIEHMDDDFVKRAFGPGIPGDLFKAVGGRWDEGPFGYSDMRPLGAYCGYTEDERYEASYARATNEDWKSGAAEMRELIEGLNAARAGGLPAIRKFFQDNFDLDALANYMAVINWMVGWDDHYHNHFFYKRPGDGRWLMLPTDLDNTMGQAMPSVPDASFFSGQWANRSNRNDYWSYLKDAYLRAFREELIERIKRLDRTVLHPDAVAELADELAAQYQEDEAAQAPGGTSCGRASDDLERLKRFAYQRSTRIAQELFD